MTATGHALIGTAIAARFANPMIGIPLAILSHVAADAFPHWDTGTNRKKKTKTHFFWESVADVSLGFFLSYLVIHSFFPATNLNYAFICIIAAQLFDWVTAPYLFFNYKVPPFTWSYKLQKHFDNRMDKPWGIIWQVAAVGGALAVAKIF